MDHAIPLPWVALGATVATLALAPLALPTPLAAQQPAGSSPEGMRGGHLSIELFRPLIRTQSGERLGWNTGGALLTYSRPLGSRSGLEAEIPFVWGFYEATGPGFSRAGSFRAMGNPRLSILNAMSQEDAPGSTALEMAVRFPLSRSSGGAVDPLWVGVLGDPTHLNRWAEDLTTLSIGLVHHRPLGDVAELRLRGAPALWFLTGDHADSQFLAEYEVAVRTSGGGVHAGADLRGIALLGSDFGGFSDRTIHRFQAEAGAPWRGWRMTAFTRVALDDRLARAARFTLGARLERGESTRR